MSIKQRIASAATAGILAAALAAAVSFLGPLTQLGLPAGHCGRVGACVGPIPDNPVAAPTHTPGPTNWIGIACPDGQHWVDTSDSYCAPDE